MSPDRYAFDKSSVPDHAQFPIDTAYLDDVGRFYDQICDGCLEVQENDGDASSGFLDFYLCGQCWFDVMGQHIWFCPYCHSFDSEEVLEGDFAYWHIGNVTNMCGNCGFYSYNHEPIS